MPGTTAEKSAVEHHERRHGHDSRQHEPDNPPHTLASPGSTATSSRRSHLRRAGDRRPAKAARHVDMLDAALVHERLQFGDLPCHKPLPCYTFATGDVPLLRSVLRGDRFAQRRSLADIGDPCRPKPLAIAPKPV